MKKDITIYAAAGVGLFLVVALCGITGLLAYSNGYADGTKYATDLCVSTLLKGGK